MVSQVVANMCESTCNVYKSHCEKCHQLWQLDLNFLDILPFLSSLTQYLSLLAPIPALTGHEYNTKALLKALIVLIETVEKCRKMYR